VGLSRRNIIKIPKGEGKEGSPKMMDSEVRGKAKKKNF